MAKIVIQAKELWEEEKKTDFEHLVSESGALVHEFQLQNRHEDSGWLFSVWPEMP